MPISSLLYVSTSGPHAPMVQIATFGLVWWISHTCENSLLASRQGHRWKYYFFPRSLRSLRLVIVSSAKGLDSGRRSHRVERLRRPISVRLEFRLVPASPERLQPLLLIGLFWCPTRWPRRPESRPLAEPSICLGVLRVPQLGTWNGIWSVHLGRIHQWYCCKNAKIGNWREFPENFYKINNIYSSTSQLVATVHRWSKVYLTSSMQQCDSID